MSVITEFSMFPVDKGESLSQYVSRLVKIVDESGVDYKLNPMGTVFETETMAEAHRLIEKAYGALEPDCQRVYATVKMDIKKSKSNQLSQKIQSVEDKIGEVKK